MRHSFLPLLAVVVLAGCATTPAGEDPKGIDMRAKATPVLAALARHRKDKGAYPASLYELVPVYLTAVPFHPGLRLDTKNEILAFVYFKEFPHIGSVTCSAKLDETTWKCVEAR